MVDVVLPPKDGFDEHDPDLTFTDHIDNVPHEYRWVGAKLTLKNESGEVMELVVSNLTKSYATAKFCLA